MNTPLETQEYIDCLCYEAIIAAACKTIIPVVQKAVNDMMAFSEACQKARASE